MGLDEPGTGVLKHSVYHFASDKGVDECCSWGITSMWKRWCV